MADKTIAEKLQIKSGTTVWLSEPSRLDLIGSLPAGATPTSDLSQATAAIVFADNAASTRKSLGANAETLGAPTVFWVAYPKGNRTDINRDTLWPILAEFGMRPIGQVAIDGTWSALRFRKLKPGEAPFTGGTKD